FISDIENRRRSPSDETLNLLSRALGVSIDHLTGESVSSIINDRITDLGVTLEQVAKKAGVPLRWLQTIDNFVPGEMDDIEGHELEWDDEIGWPRSYIRITKVAKVLGLPGSMLRSALARQEIPVYEGSDNSTPEEDFN